VLSKEDSEQKVNKTFTVEKITLKSLLINYASAIVFK